MRNGPRTSADLLDADQAGIYIVSNGEFARCSSGDPMWRREALSHSSVQDVRQEIEAPPANIGGAG